MTDTTSDAGSYLDFGCPRCGHAARDEYETLDPMSPTNWRCDRCARMFNVLLFECATCATETVFVAMIAAEQPPPVDLLCPSCHRGVLDHEEVADSF
ncbi:hypothetical protein [Piscinibacter koreensis]|uniref:Uncharacterized protein n=1 Tax=Piscinibacter koreensis TaxID=2742824 RepID=A0A7Y6NTM7_9BURK|nr:hypothetical protein [Schlegelella koreensis]NUZ09121.1 hypothetical protein [Schlegelella koreensis]